MRWYVLTKGKQVLRRERTLDDALFYAYTHYAKRTNPYKYLYVISEKDYNAKNWEAVIEVNDRDFVLKNGKVVRRENSQLKDIEIYPMDNCVVDYNNDFLHGNVRCSRKSR